MGKNVKNKLIKMSARFWVFLWNGPGKFKIDRCSFEFQAQALWGFWPSLCWSWLWWFSASADEPGSLSGAQCTVLDPPTPLLHRHKGSMTAYTNLRHMRSLQKINFRITNHVTIHRCMTTFAKTMLKRKPLAVVAIPYIPFRDPLIISGEPLWTLTAWTPMFKWWTCSKFF